VEIPQLAESLTLRNGLDRIPEGVSKYQPELKSNLRKPPKRSKNFAL
jgi:hypothetical protein